MALEHVYGWWSFDRQAQALVREDGVTLAFEGFADDIGRTPFIRWMHFRVDAPGGTFPLLVERRDLPGRFSSPLVWRADMRRSFEAIGQMPESRDEWLFVRDVVLDALGCWPDGTDAGVRPGEVAIDGRWREGRWSGEHYLLRASSEIQHKHMKPQRAGDPGPEQAWAFVPASDAALAIPVAALHDASPRALGDAIAERIERGPCLLSGERAILPFYVRSPYSVAQIRLLYVDEEIVTDRLWLSASALGDDPMRWSLSFEQDCVIGTRWRDGMRPVDFARFGRTESSTRPTENGIREWAHFPPEFIARMAESFADASFLWRDCSFAIEDLDKGVAEISIAAPVQLRLNGMAREGGMTGMRGLEVARDLSPPAFAHVFGPAEVQSVKLETDAVRFDPIAAKMSETAGPRSLAFEETIEGSSDAADSQRMLLRFDEGQRNWPVLVERPARELYYGGCGWAVDHNASLARWRAESGGDLPELGWWHGAAAFVEDALCLWPDSDATGPQPMSLRTAGGYHDHGWEERLGRHMSRVRFLPGTLGDAGPDWRAFDAPVPAPTQWRKVGSDIREEEPPEISATRFEPFDVERWTKTHPAQLAWLRADDAAMLTIAGYREVWMRDDLIKVPVFEYWDEEIRLYLHEHTDRVLSLARVFSPVARDTATFDRLAAELVNKGHYAPQAGLWMRLRDAVEGRIRAGSITEYRGRMTMGRFAEMPVMKLWIDDGRLQDWQKKLR
jgi:hypothetical protein